MANEFSCDCNIIHAETVDKVEKAMISEETFNNLSNFYKVIADLTRLKILYALNQSELCVCDIASVLKMSKSAVSHQLRTLRNNNLVRTHKVGKVVYYHLADHHVKDLIEEGLEHIMEGIEL